MLQCLRYWFYGLETSLLPKLVKEFPTFRRVRKLRCVFTSVRHMDLSWARYIQFIFSHTDISDLLECCPISTPFFSKLCVSMTFLCRKPAWVSLLPCTYQMPSTSQPLWFDHWNIWWGVQLMKFLVMQFSVTVYSFLPFGSKYYPKHPLLEQPQFVFFPPCNITSAYVKDYRQNCSLVGLSCSIQADKKPTTG
jgi:hypothetical protein